jgi:hypothetical protein
MAPRKTDQKQKAKRRLSKDQQVDLWTTIRMNKWAISPNGLVRQLGLANAWDELNKPFLKPIGLAEAAEAHGLEINQKTGALVFDGEDVAGTDDVTWNTAPSPGAQPPSVRFALLRLRADAVGVRMPESNSLDDYEEMIIAAERVTMSVQMPSRDRLTIVESIEKSNAATNPSGMTDAVDGNSN